MSERRRTRDLLLKPNEIIIPFNFYTTNLKNIYLWEN